MNITHYDAAEHIITEAGYYRLLRAQQPNGYPKRLRRERIGEDEIGNAFVSTIARPHVSGVVVFETLVDGDDGGTRFYRWATRESAARNHVAIVESLREARMVSV